MVRWKPAVFAKFCHMCHADVKGSWLLTTVGSVNTDKFSMLWSLVWCLTLKQQILKECLNSPVWWGGLFKYSNQDCKEKGIIFYWDLKANEHEKSVQLVILLQIYISSEQYKLKSNVEIDSSAFLTLRFMPDEPGPVHVALNRVLFDTLFSSLFNLFFSSLYNLLFSSLFSTVLAHFRQLDRSTLVFQTKSPWTFRAGS